MRATCIDFYNVSFTHKSEARLEKGVVFQHEYSTTQPLQLLALFVHTTLFFILHSLVRVNPHQTLKEKGQLQVVYVSFGMLIEQLHNNNNDSCNQCFEEGLEHLVPN